MDEILKKLQGLKKQMNRGVLHHADLLRKNAEGAAANEQLKVENSLLKERVQLLEEELKTLKLAQALKGSDDQGTQQLKQQINTYIREIDRCLAMLNRDI